MNIIDSLKWRYAVKKFDTNKNLSEKQIETLKEAFNLTATSYGLQPLKLVIIKNKKNSRKTCTVLMESTTDFASISSISNMYKR